MKDPSTQIINALSYPPPAETRPGSINEHRWLRSFLAQPPMDGIPFHDASSQYY
ncbi:MAG TPA: hypothetical protein VMW24_21915 [Sedimentisphaerales bacterium]|nr:hypothetical protein [Sedimentisphaerales bacterium]